MALTEILVVKLGARLGKILLKSYLQDPAEAVGEDLLEIAQGKIEDYREQRKAARQFEDLGEQIAVQLQPLLDREFRNDAVSVEAVVEELGKALGGRISAPFFLKRDLDPDQLLAELKRIHPLPYGQFSQAEEQLYERMLLETVHYVVEIADKLPRFEVSQIREGLARLSRLEDMAGETASQVKHLRQVVESWDSDAERQKYEVSYRLAVIRNLDYLELFGADLTQESRRQALSVAYVSLSLDATEANPEAAVPTSVETLLSGLQESREALFSELQENNTDKINRKENKGRLLIRGEAGSGKSTLFRWTAIQAARAVTERSVAFSSQSDKLRKFDVTPPSSWRLRVPFLLRLRDCKGGKLPSPEDFPEMIAKELGSPPSTWVRSILSAKRALLLFDGLDEIPNHHRDTAHKEITAIVEAYPGNLVLVSTRPEAVPENWLGALGFREARVNPMSELDRARFIDKWHEAVAVELGKLGKPADDLPRLAAELKQQLPDNPPVARLATNPLLCAMICALHKDRNQKLPESQSELCEHLCEVLLHRRERESGLDLSEFPEVYRKLTYPQKRIIVQEIAHFMVLNEESSITTAQAQKKVGDALKRLAGQSEDDAKIVCDSLVERSGMFRESKPGHLDFIHNTFKEYLAGEQFANSGDTGILVKEALNASWQRVVLFAVATPRQEFAKEVVHRLISKAQEAKTLKEHRGWQLVALQCGAAALLMDRKLEAELNDIARELFPPQSMEDAAALASGGDAVIPFLRYRNDLKTRKIAACVRTLRLIGTVRAKATLGEYLEDSRDAVVAELSQAVNPLTILKVRTMLLAGEPLPEGIRNQISDLSPLTSCSSLHTLDLRRTQVLDLSSLAGRVSLQTIDLRFTQVSDLSPLSGCINLQTLDLSFTQVSDLSPLSSCINLQRLDLIGTQVSDLSPLGDYKNLKTLDISRTKVSDLSPLADCTNLRMLFIISTKISDLSPLASCKKLQRLFLSETPILDFSPLADLQELQIFR